MLAAVRNAQGAVVGQVEVSEALFGVAMNRGIVHQALVRQRANARAGTASTKTRGEVRGGGRKPWRQKGTGRARAGSIRSPLWRGGGIVFGPRPRKYHQAMPKKMRRLALKACLSDKLAHDRLILVEGFGLETPRTADLLRLLQILGAERSTLLVTRQADVTVIRSARNIPGVKTLPAPLLNVGDLLKYRHLVMTVEAVRRAEEIWAPAVEAAEPAEEPMAQDEAEAKGEKEREG